MRIGLAVLLCAAAARAQDSFEIQVYDVETAPPMTAGVEVHVNEFFHGTTETSPAGELPTRHVAHLTLEPHLGLTKFLEAGVYLHSALRPAGTYDYPGTKLRRKRPLREPPAGWLRLAVTGQLSRI